MSQIFEHFQSLILSRPHYMARGFINVDCPACGDKRKRGGFAPTPTGGFRYSCFNGGCPYNSQSTGWEEGNGLVGRVRDLFEMFGGDIRDIPVKDMMKRRESTVDADGNTVVKPKLTIVTKFPDTKLPKGVMLLDNASESSRAAEEVMAYLWERSPLFLESDFPFMWSPKHPEHLLIPYIHYDDQIVGYLGRHIDVASGDGRFIQRSPSDYMFNQYLMNANDQKYLYVMESPLDAILMQGIATRDNRLTKRQINLLNTTHRQPVLIPDLHTGEASAYITAAEDNNWLIAAPDWEYKDPGEAIHRIGLLNTIEAITESMTNNYSRAKIRARMSA